MKLRKSFYSARQSGSGSSIRRRFFVRILSIITDSKIRGDFPPGLILKKFAKNA